ncbi:MAG: hypothetical protein IJ210_11375 [Clostridia bacterium]|nr:hypothetical protein [Clostridia bacterium]
MSFYTFMARNYKSSPLMHVMRTDRERFPRNGPHKLKAWGPLIRDYLLRHPELYAPDHVTEFDVRWEEYLQCVKR